MMEMYMIMAQKVVETGDMLYWMKNYGEYMRLVFSNPVTAVAYTVPMVMVIIMVIFLIAMTKQFVRAIKQAKADYKEYKEN